MLSFRLPVYPLDIHAFEMEEELFKLYYMS